MKRSDRTIMNLFILAYMFDGLDIAFNEKSYRVYVNDFALFDRFRDCFPENEKCFLYKLDKKGPVRCNMVIE